MNLNSPHDKFFKEKFSNVAVAKDFLSNYLLQSVIIHIAKTDSAALKLLLVNSFKFQEVEDARKYIQ